MALLRIDHVGVVVDDLVSVKKFLKSLGLEVMGEADVGGEWVEQIIGLKKVKETVVMMRVPGGEAMIELVKFHTPADAKGVRESYANTLGIRHIAFAVEDIGTIVTDLASEGGELVGEVKNYEDTYKLCYIRGPENIIVELAEKIKK